MQKAKVGYAGEKPARVCMFTPSGSRWFDCHEKAVAAVKIDYPAAVHVKRWQENHLQYEDYQDGDGNTLVQLEFAGPAVLAAGYTYSNAT
jgi:hypothetical protein